MGRFKLAICLEDREYRDRFVKCMMNHYRERYELHVFESIEELMVKVQDGYQGFIISDSMIEALKSCAGGEDYMKRTQVLTEANMYQEVYRIVQELELIIGDVMEIPSGREKTRIQIIGVLSLAAAQMQLSFATMLAELCKEEGRTILLDLQAYSGLANAEENAGPGLEDIMAAAESGTISKSRLQSAIGHRNAWDYVRPVKNADYLREGAPDMLEKILEGLISQQEYRTVIVNLGESFGSWQNLVEQCDICYFLYPRGNVGSWREESLVQEMHRRGHGECLHRICRIEIPTALGQEEDWENIGIGWKWSPLGDQVRGLLSEVSHGQTV